VRATDGKFIAYYRVSTDHQGANGNGCAAQIQRRVALAVARSYSCARRFGPIVEGFSEHDDGERWQCTPCLMRPIMSVWPKPTRRSHDSAAPPKAPAANAALRPWAARVGTALATASAPEV
jgi:hypothetical protein